MKTKMKDLLVLVILAQLIAINFAYVHLDTTTEKGIKPQKVPKILNFAKVDLNRDETLNEKIAADDVPKEEEATTKADDSMPTKATTTIDNHLSEDGDIVSTTENVATTTTTEASATFSQNTNNGDTSSNKARWFFVGAAAGVVVSVIAIYAYNFRKSRSEPFYQNF